MKKKDTVDVLLTLADFQKNILENKPSREQMFEEVRMMHFKIRPLQGDVLLLNLKEHVLIEMLWNLGKLDEFFHRHDETLTPGQKEVFLNFFDELYDRFQTQLNKINLRSVTGRNLASTIEMEIFKDDLRKPN